MIQSRNEQRIEKSPIHENKNGYGEKSSPENIFHTKNKIEISVLYINLIPLGE